ncbi:MAG TPA: hypothetical protein VFX30_00255 [bacterium]|nr:hypothetical protein [bacterium]
MRKLFRKTCPPFFAALTALAALLFLPTEGRAFDGVTVDDSNETETVVTVQIELCADPADDPETPAKEGLTKEEVQAFADAQDAAVTAIWNACPNRFRLRRGAPLKNVRFEFEFTVLDNCNAERDPNKKRFPVHPGKAPSSSRENADTENLWIENTDRTVAHELGHVMGLGEEYGYDGGPTRENLMGRGNFTAIVPYHVMTILFVYSDNPDAAEINRRRLMKTLLKMADQKTARKIAAQNDITAADYDAYKDRFAANGSQVQPGPPTK